MIRTERIASIGAVAPLSDDWNRLARGMPFRRWEWLGPWWKQYGDGHELYVLAVYDSDSLIGLAPWYQEQSLAHGRVIRWLGSGDACSDYMSLLTAPEHQSIVTEAIGEWLAASGSDEAQGDCWDLLRLEAVETSDPVVAELVERLGESGHAVHSRPGPSCWRVPVAASWDDYLRLLSKPNRRKVRWAEKQLQARCAVRQVTTLDGFEPAWRMLVDLHQRRWRALGQPGCFTSERFTCFLREATERLLPGGRARLLWVEKEGRSLAAELHLCDAENTYAYQVGLSPDDLAENPGWLVNTASLRCTHAAGQTGFDLLRGDEPYKSHLGAQPRGTVDLRIVSRRVRSQLRSSAWRAGDALRDLIKGGLGMSRLRPRE